jgi:hypothetical protein
MFALCLRMVYALFEQCLRNSFNVYAMFAQRLRNVWAEGVCANVAQTFLPNSVRKH